MATTGREVSPDGAAGGAAAPAAGAGIVLRVLRDGHPRTRSELAELTGMARSTLGQRLDGLLASRLIAPMSPAGSTGGRPPQRFRFHPGARVVVAADVGATHVRVALTDLDARVLVERSADLPIVEGPEVILGWLVDAAQVLLDEAGRSREDVAGVGVGLPGPVEHATGRPVNPPIMPGWHHFDVPAFLQARLPAPALVDNDVNIMALGEHYASWPGESDLIFVKVATGIGAGIVSNGRLLRGALGAAGDLGHIRVPDGADLPCRCGNTGCLEAVAAGPALAARLRRSGIDASGAADVLEHVRQGTIEAVQVVRQAGRDLGGVLAACVNLLNPSVIVIGGSVAEAGEQLLAGVRETVYTRSLPLATAELRIVQSTMGSHAAVTGAAVMVIEHVLSPAAVDLALSEASPLLDQVAT